MTLNLLDKILSGVALIILAPVFVIISIAIFVDTGCPVIYRSSRIGKGKKVFSMYKFRTMFTSAPENVASRDLSSPEVYVTAVGQILRKYSLDETLQFFNVLKGDMSIVGVRPAAISQADLICLRDSFGLNEVKPGITGFAQISGRDNLDIHQKVGFELKHLQPLTLKRYLGLLAKTVVVVAVGKDVRH